MTARTLATQLVAVAVLTDMLAEARDALRVEMLPKMLPGDRQTATVDVDGHGVKVGSVTSKIVEPGMRGVTVTNSAALADWCRRHAPDELQTVVRPAFQQRLLDVVLSAGGWPDPSTGEVIAVDGVEFITTAPSSPGLVVTKSKSGPALIRAEIAAGRLTFADVLALPAGTP